MRTRAPAAAGLLAAAALLLLPAVSHGGGLPAFRWDTLSVFAFPGALPRFMTADEVAGFVANFSSINIWGLNATCVNATTGTASPANCPPAASHCWCDEAHPESQTWELTMETSLQAQGAALLAEAAAQGKPEYFALGYIEYLSIQQYYKAQMELVNNASLAATSLLSVASRGLIDCYVDGCNWQGTEFRQYDLRNPAVQAYYVAQVIGSLIAGPGLNGTFLDSIDWWTTSACDSWPCTVDEAEALTLASLATLNATLASAAALGKLISVSSHTTLAETPSFYAAQIAILAAYPAAAIRFWEFFKPIEEHLETLIYETATLRLATQVHVQTRTLAPDWLELAVFLLGAGESSYFSCSGPWNVDSFAIYPEYSAPLGAPLGAASRASEPEPVAPWALLPSQNLVDNLPPAPNQGVPGVVEFLGLQPSAAACLAAVRANASYTAMTWANADDKTWAQTCWGRLDAQDWPACITGELVGAPCYAAPEATCVSAIATAWTRNVTTWRRSFEHLNVVWWPANSSATLTPV